MEVREADGEENEPASLTSFRIFNSTKEQVFAH